jgi:hypothetical protein
MYSLTGKLHWACSQSQFTAEKNSRNMLMFFHEFLQKLGMANK